MFTLGCATFAYLYTCSLDEAVGRLADIGFRQIELCVSPPHVWPREMDAAARRAMRRIFDRHGVQLFALNQRFADVNIASVNPGIREETIRQVKEDIDLAADLGAPEVLIVPGKPTPLFSPPPEEIWRLARGGVAECVAHAERRGVLCVLENTGYSLCPTGRDLVRLAQEIGSPFCRVHYDVANANVCESPVEGLRTIGAWLASLHVSDNDGQTWTHSPVGAGTIDWPGVAQALRDVSFQGMSILEINVYHEQDRAMADAVERLRPLGWAL
ncbi:MAG: sugar phosphate isomerase/epimerase [Chloroflexi bacterium]|nr:sugar phosphate isomerase/epimerase [Chloroflexota bacterium]